MHEVSTALMIADGDVVDGTSAVAANQSRSLSSGD
jgi:hypothetical protein